MFSRLPEQVASKWYCGRVRASQLPYGLNYWRLGQNHPLPSHRAYRSIRCHVERENNPPVRVTRDKQRDGRVSFIVACCNYNRLLALMVAQLAHCEIAGCLLPALRADPANRWRRNHSQDSQINTTFGSPRLRSRNAYMSVSAPSPSQRW